MVRSRLVPLAAVVLLTSSSARVGAREIDPPGRVLPEVAVPLARAHADSDYEHLRPLADALAQGFSSVEAAVWASGGQLLVARHYFGTSTNRTLRSLYLDPLRKRVVARGGSVYSGSQQSLQLLIEVKWDPERTYRAIHTELSRYADLLTRYENGTVYRGPVTAIITGQCPRELLRKQSLRYAACDGRLEDLRPGGSDASLAPLVSERWDDLFKWTGKGAMPSAERVRLLQLVKVAHARRQQLRLMGTPDEPAVWDALVSAGVDYIGSTSFDRLRHFLLPRDAR